MGSRELRSLIVTIAGSPSASSRTSLLASTVGAVLGEQGFDVQGIDTRELPAEDLVHQRADSPALQRALDLVARSKGVVITTPVYKASYTGLLKLFLDLLPQFGLGGKVALPIVTGGTLAHVLAIDYALRPVLLSLGAQHVVTGLFILDKLIERRADGRLVLEQEIQNRLDGVIADFALSVRRQELSPHRPLAG